MVQNNNIDEAMQILNGIMQREGLTKRWRGTRVYEKPTWVGNISNEDDEISFIISLRPETELTLKSARLFMTRI